MPELTEEALSRFIEELEGSEQNTRFNRLVTICTRAFGEPARSRGRGSHVKFKTPWKGDPRINLQRSKDGKAKAYQVEQVLKALRKLQEGEDE